MTRISSGTFGIIGTIAGGLGIVAGFFAPSGGLFLASAALLMSTAGLTQGRSDEGPHWTTYTALGLGAVALGVSLFFAFGGF